MEVAEDKGKKKKTKTTVTKLEGLLKKTRA